MVRIGITGAYGFLGWHLRALLHANPEFQTVRNEIRALLRKPLEHLLENRSIETNIHNISLTAFVIDESVEACLHRNMTLDTPFIQEELVEELAKMIVGYLEYSGESDS